MLDKRWYQVHLVEVTGGDRQFDLGQYRCETSDVAQKRAAVKYRNVITKFQTHTFELRVLESAPPGSRQRVAKPKVFMATLFP